VTRILQITPYPTRHPAHGGQFRAHHTARILEAAGHTVDRMGVFRHSEFAAAGEAPIVDLDKAQIERRFPSVWQVANLTTNELAATDNGCYLAFANRVRASRPDILMLEEPWLWPAVRRWRGDFSPTHPVIYNAYNIEYRAKAAMLTDAKVPAAGAIVGEVKALERGLMQSADAVSATTAEDAAVIEAWIGKKVAVARNGTVLRHVEHLCGVLPAPLEPWHRFLLFVGSAYPPNATGFWDIVIPALSALRSNQRIVVAGSVSHLVQSRADWLDRGHMGRDRLVVLGQVSELALSCLLGNATGIILPITYGGGSNLKTAEALASGLPIVGTSMAFRGFGEYARWPNVTIADEPAAFAAGIRGLFDASSVKPAGPVPKELLWDSTLQPIISLVEAMADLSDDASGSALRGADANSTLAKLSVGWSGGDTDLAG
jgi:glycosyltransferase involved in cell wall biosynthesis